MRVCLPEARAFLITCGLTALRGTSVLAGVAEPIATGHEVGERIPQFEARNQNGELRCVDDLTGRDGLLLLFHRTAD